MRQMCLALVGIGLLAAAGMSPAQANKDAAIKQDRDNLIGTWSLISILTGGKEVDITTLVGAKLIFERYKVDSQRVRLGPTSQVLYQIDPTLTPKTIDFVHADKTVTPGIYHLDGNKLKICNNVPNAPRPKTFESKLNSGIVLMILRRD